MGVLRPLKYHGQWYQAGHGDGERKLVDVALTQL